MAREFENAASIRQILLLGRFDDLVGVQENDIFEAKSQPWDLNSEPGKVEFAKDVSSMANSRGGVIVIGAKTAPSLAQQRDEVQEIHTLDKSFAPTDRYLHVLRDWIYPIPQEIEFEWYPSSADANRGLLAVHIPSQADDLKPFLVAHYSSEAGRRMGAILGYFHRSAETTRPTVVQEFHTLLREGRRLDVIHQKLDTIVARIEAGNAGETTWMKRILRMLRSHGD